jgi:hypothetical protein
MFKMGDKVQYKAKVGVVITDESTFSPCAQYPITVKFKTHYEYFTKDGRLYIDADEVVLTKEII